MFLRKATFVLTDVKILSSPDIQNSNSIRDYKRHGIKNSGKNDSFLSQHTTENSGDIPTAVNSRLQANSITFSTKHDLIPTIYPVTEGTEDIKYKHSRFVLSYSYWEQQTNALINMWSLQKWADKSGKLKVVEPFAVESVLEFPGSVLYKHQFTNALRFRDYFDLDYWTKETAKLGIEPLVSWETFLKYANREVIVAITTLGANPPGVYIDDEINKNKRCKYEQNKISHNTKSLFKFLHFKIIKTVCYAISYKLKNILSFQKFNSHLIPNSNATIWFGYWYGIGRLPMTGDRTLDRVHGGIENILGMVHASPTIIIDSRNYIKTVLNADFREYTAIVIRSARRYAEMVLKGCSSNDVMSYFTRCVGKLNKILDKSGSTSYFLGTDIGKFGDRTAYKLNDNDSAKLLQQLLQVLYGNKTIDVYQNEFIKAANGVEDRGYLATMQKTIAEHAKCLIMMGGYSTFQRNIVLNYENGGQFKCIRYLCYEDPVKPSHKQSHGS